MQTKNFLVAVLLAAVVLASCSANDIADDSAPDTDSRAPLFQGMGAHHFPITIASDLAQRYFDQGLTLYYGFNHAEAERSFRQAAALDGQCAMCWWGVALSLGPNINAVMEDAAVPRAWEALNNARLRLRFASDWERAYVEALATRYVAAPVADRGPLDLAYAEAMAQLVRRYPADLEAATLYAEAVMDTIPWDYWIDGDTPRLETEPVLASLELVLERNPYHPGANHFYIHAVEASDQPQRALAAADRLGGLAPGAGHLVHMPSHIYLRLGRYEEAAVANERADEADLSYVSQCHAQGVYPLAYHSHNLHFLWYARAMQGRGEEALAAARRVAEKAEGDVLRMPGMETMQFYWATPLFTLVRFGRWQEILEEPRPAEDLLLPNAIWRYARGLAQLRGDHLDAAAAELAELAELAAAPVLAELKIWGMNPFASVVTIAREILAGELALARGDAAAAIAHFERGVEVEDQLLYNEPPDWHAAVRLHLGVALLAAGDAERAEAIYREDLRKHPGNGWALFGLWQSLTARGDSEQAAQVEILYRQTWQGADVELAAARL